MIVKIKNQNHMKTKQNKEILNCLYNSTNNDA